ncbi:MAG: HD domain-containing protein [Bacteroidales bacterium]|nr:HD domain-containing protein [Bacteroidales bacterium]
MDKEQKYRSLLPQAVSLIGASKDLVADMANLSALLHQEMGWWWTGFYRAVGNELVLGPFQGPVACTRIGFGKGVCGSAWERGETVIVPDVEAFPGHIACSTESRSEIVVPVRLCGEIRAVLDIDSRELACFDGTDRLYLERICTELACRINPELRAYVESEILPRYDSFDKGHRRDHAETVIAQSLQLSTWYDVQPDLVYTAAACHDIGLCEDRATHHIVSARLIREDTNLQKWFNAKQIALIADAAEDHRASSGHEPRTIYGKLIAEADRQILPETVIRRTIQYGLSHYPGLDREGHWARTLEHLHEKYAEGGYLRLWIPQSPNAARLEELRRLIRDEARLRTLFETFYQEENDQEPHI